MMAPSRSPPVSSVAPLCTAARIDRSTRSASCWVIRVPMPVSVEPGSPVLIFCTRGTSASRKSPAIFGWVITRCTEMHTCPAFTNPPRATAAAAASMSASGSTTTGQEAPSSRESFFTPARWVMRVPVSGRSGERDLVHPWVADQRIAEFPAGAGQHRQHTLRKSGVHEARGEREGGQRCRAGRFEDHGIPGRQRRRDLVQHQQGRVVERRDGHHHTDRLADRETRPCRSPCRGSRPAATSRRRAGFLRTPPTGSAHRSGTPRRGPR